MLGLVLLVLAGVAMSMFVESTSYPKTKQRELEYEVTKQAGEIQKLKKIMGYHQREIQDDQAREMHERAHLAALDARIQAMMHRKNDASRLREKLGNQIQNLEASYHADQIRVRMQVWAAAPREALDTLETSDGRIYQDARIINVAEAGVTIRHQNGVAFIGVGFLPENLREKLLYNIFPKPPHGNE